MTTPTQRFTQTLANVGRTSMSSSTTFCLCITVFSCPASIVCVCEREGRHTDVRFDVQSILPLGSHISLERDYTQLSVQALLYTSVGVQSDSDFSNKKNKAVNRFILKGSSSSTDMNGRQIKKQIDRLLGGLDRRFG